MSISHTATTLKDTRLDRHESILEFLLTFNRSLDRDTVDLPNEALLARRWDSLQGLEERDSPLFWLTVARLTELALKLAGDYADAGAFQAAGDLLVNPRRVDVYQRGTPLPTPKIRHGALSEQFADAIGDDNPVDWIKRHLLTHVKTEALLPQFLRMLAASGVMAADYVACIERRMGRVADTITFLNAWCISDCTDLQRRWAAADAEDRELIAVHRCHFTLHRFAALGDDVERWLCDEYHQSRFLGLSNSSPMVLHSRQNDEALHSSMR